MNVINEVNKVYIENKDNELSFWKWLWNFTYENEILLIHLNKNWILPHSRYSIRFKDENLEYYSLLNKEFKKIDDELFAKHANKCVNKINPKNGTLFFTTESFGSTYFSYRSN